MIFLLCIDYIYYTGIILFKKSVKIKINVMSVFFCHFKNINHLCITSNFALIYHENLKIK